MRCGGRYRCYCVAALRNTPRLSVPVATPVASTWAYTLIHTRPRTTMDMALGFHLFESALKKNVFFCFRMSPDFSGCDCSLKPTSYDLRIQKQNQINI